MLEEMISRLPEQWREVAQLLALPIGWIPRAQQLAIDFFLSSSSPWAAAAKYVFLLFPVLLVVVAVWCTQLSIYTMPFRSRRVGFLSTMLVTWWDAARAIWMYWVGVVRLVAVLAGWALTLVRLAMKLAVEAVRQIAVMPFSVTGRMTDRYFQSGVPWIAVLMLLFWCALEATIFTYTLLPTVSEVLLDLVGTERVPFLTGPILWFFLLLLIMGSFACIQAMVDAVRRREFKFIVQIVLVELFVMFFEVMFLYRELIDAITPWIAQQTGDQFRPGIMFTVTLATFGWIGIRGMTWFLFGQYGTPLLLAFISRQAIATPEGRPTAPELAGPARWWKAPLEDFKLEVEWLHSKGDQLLEYFALPVLHLFAAALNFGMVMVTARPLFSLPFRGLKDVMETREILNGLALQPRRQGNL